MFVSNGSGKYKLHQLSADCNFNPWNINQSHDRNQSKNYDSEDLWLVANLKC